MPEKKHPCKALYDKFDDVVSKISVNEHKLPFPLRLTLILVMILLIHVMLAVAYPIIYFGWVWRFIQIQSYKVALKILTYLNHRLQ